jgi:2-C-methyl-D-erythritol 4-phosphate cytidylyltransferase
VLIHDAARPLAGRDMFDTALSVAREFGGAIPALTITDVVEQGPAGVESTSGRGRLVRVQTPQAFRAGPLLSAYRAAAADGFEGTDTSSCIEKFTDVDVRTFDGEERNLKVTYAHDIAVAEHLLTTRRSAGTR